MLALVSLLTTSSPLVEAASPQRTGLTGNSLADPSNAVLEQIRTRIEHLLASPQPEPPRGHAETHAL
jgi:hypothetical protein